MSNSSQLRMQVSIWKEEDPDLFAILSQSASSTWPLVKTMARRIKKLNRIRGSTKGAFIDIISSGSLPKQ